MTKHIVAIYMGNPARTGNQCGAAEVEIGADGQEHVLYVFKTTKTWRGAVRAAKAVRAKVAA